MGTTCGSGRNFELASGAGLPEVVPVERLAEAGVPHLLRTSRLPYEGSFSDWGVGTAKNYLSGLGMVLPAGIEGRHTVFSIPAEQGCTIMVPALVLMRAFFKPVPLLMSAVFSPAGTNLLSFVDYRATPPAMIPDGLELLKQFLAAHREVAAKMLKWLQLSRSAQKMCQSAFLNACDGHLGLSLPDGRMRIVFHGRWAGSEFLAVKATAIFAEVPARDSITGKGETFFLHEMADSARETGSHIRDWHVPLRQDGICGLDAGERLLVEPVLRGQTTRLSQPLRWDVLDIVLGKLSSGVSWKRSVQGSRAMTCSDAAGAFRRWSLDGRLAKILEILKSTRAPSL